jgi:hypothetical protein
VGEDVAVFLLKCEFMSLKNTGFYLRETLAGFVCVEFTSTGLQVLIIRHHTSSEPCGFACVGLMDCKLFNDIASTAQNIDMKM